MSEADEPIIFSLEENRAEPLDAGPQGFTYDAAPPWLQTVEPQGPLLPPCYDAVPRS